MRLTNKLGLPEAIVDAIKNDDYTKGKSQISITGLIQPPRIRVLKKKFGDVLEEDASSRIFSLLGQIMHRILERANKHGLAETRFYLNVDGILISGESDILYEDGLLQDYKLTSLFHVKNGVPEDFEQQLNCYVYLIKHGYYYLNDDHEERDVRSKSTVVPTRLEDVCILRDWSKSKARQDQSLPQQQVIKLEVPLWSDEKTLAFIKERIRIHKAANKVLPECTVEERWADEYIYAAMPFEGASKSRGNYDKKEDAEAHVAKLKEKNPEAFVETRPAISKRCIDNYCGVNSVCSQWAQIKSGRKTIVNKE